MYIITKSQWGGAQRYVFDLASSLPTGKFDVSVILGGEGILKEKLETLKNRGKASQEEALPLKEEKKNNIKVISIPDMERDLNFSKDLKTFFSLLKILKKEKPDVIHLNSSKAGGIGALAGRLAGIKKIIFTGHGWAFNEDRSWLSKLSITFFHWLTIIMCHKTIAVSKKTREQIIEEMPFISKKITVIHNGIKIDEEQFYSRDEARQLLFQKTHLFSKNINISSVKTAWIGTIAELHKNKGIKYAIKALKNISLKLREQNKSLVYFVIGEGERRKKLEKLIKENNLETEVFLIGKIDNAVKYLKAFDIFLLTSKTEALPYVLLEAGSANLPIIASNVGGVSEIIEDMKTGILVPRKKTEDIENALISLLSDNEMRGKMAQSLGHKIKTEFSFEKMFEETVKLYDLIL